MIQYYLWKEHIKAILLIPQLSEKAIFIGEEENEDKKRNPNIVKYKYFAAGIKIDDNDYTCKVVIGVDNSKNCYYDQSLSTIEKGKLIDILQEKNKLEAENFELAKEDDNNLSPLMTQREVISSYVYYDKRLINICQVPQIMYLDEDFNPTLAAVQAVHKGLLYIEKSLEWTHREGLLLPQRMTTQGSLNVTQKEDIVNKRTPNFALSERKPRDLPKTEGDTTILEKDDKGE